ncbi:Methyltransferase type 11 [Colletotrichum camelliae]|nr:Methyltransferase type 11 [Colletotrichum camelliae]
MHHEQQQQQEPQRSAYVSFESRMHVGQSSTASSPANEIAGALCSSAATGDGASSASSAALKTGMWLEMWLKMNRMVMPCPAHSGVALGTRAYAVALWLDPIKSRWSPEPQTPPSGAVATIAGVDIRFRYPMDIQIWLQRIPAPCTLAACDNGNASPPTSPSSPPASRSQSRSRSLSPSKLLPSSRPSILKRHHRLLSPPSDDIRRDMDDPTTPRNKRQRTDHDGRQDRATGTAVSDTDHEQRNEPAGLVPADTNDDTPRQHPTNSTQTAAPALDVSASPSRRGSKRNGKDGPKSKASVSSRSTTTTSSAGLSASVASSPRYRIAAMSLEAEGLETRQATLNDPRAPRALSDMLAKIYRWSNHRSIIGSALKNPESGISDDLRTAWLLEDDVFSTPTSFAGDSGSTVSPQHVLDLLQNACDCYTRGDSEIGWNFEVHHKLLRMVLRSSPQPRLLDFSACQSAKIITEYLPTSGTHKLVDFCAHITPPAAEEEAITKLRRRQPMKTVNHTGYLALAGRPITFSIETKREDMDMDAAVLQIGTWCAAQWKMLRLLLEDLHGEEGAQIALRELAFLPAIFVHGHDWSFAATTQEGRKAILWSKMPIGSTTQLQGVYAIATALEYLGRWSTETYWPWYKKNILDRV